MTDSRPARRAIPRSLDPTARRLALGLFVALALLPAPMAASTDPPRLEFASPRLEFAEDDAHPYVTLRLARCGARQPAGLVDVRVLAVDGTAEEGVDFFAFGHARLGTALSEGAEPRVFRDLEVPLEIVHDELDEETEDFELKVEVDAGATLDCGGGPQPIEVGAPATVRILDVPKDLSLISFDTEEAHVTEGDGDDVRNARLVVHRTGGIQPVSVLCQTVRSGTASEGADFTPVESVLGWGEGDVEDKECVVPVLADDLPENRETVAVELVPLAGRLQLGTSSATLSIHDDDSPGRVQFTTVRRLANEHDRQATLEVERKWGSEGDAAVRVRITPRGASPGEDYQPVEQVLTWANGEEGIRELTVPLVDDQVREGEELLLFHLEAATPGTRLGDLVDAVLVVEDDDS